MAERPEACAEWQDDLAGWLVAQLPPEREAVLVAHLHGCEHCREEATGLLAVTAVSLSADPDDPAATTGSVELPAELRGRVAASLARERRATTRPRSWLAAAVVVALVAAVGAGVLLAGGDGEDRLDGESVRLALVPDGAQVDAVLAAHGDGSLVEVVGAGFDPDQTYALWLTEPGDEWEDRVPAGTFRPDAEGEVDARLDCALPAHKVDRVWATDADGEIAFDTDPP